MRSVPQSEEPTMTTSWDVLNQAHHALRTAVASVGAAEWTLPTPCELWTVTQVLQHAAGDQLGYAAALTGTGGPAEDPFAPSGVRPDDPASYLEVALGASAAAWSAVAPGAQNVPTPLPHGALGAEVAVGACALDAAVHAWDIAVATGQPTPLTADLAKQLLPVATAIVEPLRAYGVYAAALDSEPTDDAAAELLRYLGRRPEWTR
jgi:uncharacterized protein (TIGR03086 family)